MDDQMRQNWLLQSFAVVLTTSLGLGGIADSAAAQQVGPQAGGNVGGARQVQGAGQTPQGATGQGNGAQPSINGGNAPLGQPLVSPIVQANAGQLPCPFEPLPQDHQDYLQKLLVYWEDSTSQIQRFRCTFNRWDYDPVFGPGPDPATGEMQAATIATGEIKYQDPDKAMYEVTGKWNFQAGDPAAGVKAEYIEAPAEVKEKWISDGRFTFEFDYTSSQLRKRELPLEMQGKTIADGPIPFIFGAKAAKMNARYWIRVITPTEAQDAGEYWLEAYPKQVADAQDFSRVKVILDKQFLPKAVEIYAADYDDLRNRKSQTYVFQDRKINENNLNLFKILDRNFFDPAIPNGWQLVEVKLNAGVAQGGTVAPQTNAEGESTLNR